MKSSQWSGALVFSRYRTVMTNGPGCPAPIANLFSNPDIYYLGLPTGTTESNNARTIRDNMVRLGHC